MTIPSFLSVSIQPGDLGPAPRDPHPQAEAAREYLKILDGLSNP